MALSASGLVDHVKELIKRAAADYVEVRLEDTHKTTVVYQGPVLETLEEKRDMGGNVRALVGGAWGFVSFQNLAELERKLEQAVAFARLASQHVIEPLPLAPSEPIERVIPLEVIANPRDVPLSDKLALLGAYNEQILSHAQQIASSVVRYFDASTRLVFVNSEGTCVTRDKIDLGGSFIAVARAGGLIQRGVVGVGSSNDYHVIEGREAELTAACEAAVENLKAEVAPGDEYTVVVDPKLTGVFIHEAFGHLSEGDNTYEDPRLMDVLTLGREFGRPFLNVHDTGLDVGLRGALPVDDEGVPTRRTELIQGGKLVGRLHSRETAGKMGEQATGNARALTYKHPPIPRMRNTVIAADPGGPSFQEMVAGVDKGLYVIDAYGGQTNGELFTFTAGQAFMIRAGKVCERVRDVTLSGNVFSTLKNIDAVGRDFVVRDSGGGCGKRGQMPLPVSHGGPHIRIQGVVIGGK